MGELPHGKNGIIEDYMQLLNLRSHSSVKEALQLMSQKKRIANKKTCPCQCGKRLGKCETRHKINNLRKLMPRSSLLKHEWFINNL